MSPRQIFSQANTPLKRWLLNFAAKRKGAEVSGGIIRSDSIWDKIFFSRIQVKPKASSASLASASSFHRTETPVCHQPRMVQRGSVVKELQMEMVEIDFAAQLFLLT